jgi:hypothetical protein
MNAHTAKILLVVCLLANITACNEKAASPGVEKTESNSNNNAMADSADTAAAELAKVPDPFDPCRLLEPKEVEVVLGAPLAFAPYRGGQAIGDSAAMPQEDGDACWYFSTNNQNVVVQAEWKDAGAINAAVGGYAEKVDKASKGMLKLQDGTELTGYWDEAKVVSHCALEALQGDSMVSIDFCGSLKTTVEQAGKLANKALPRLSKPLDISGLTGQKAGEQRLAGLYKSEDPCSLFSAADITKLLGAPKGEPERSGDDCTYVYKNASGRQIMFNATTTLRNGYRSFRRDNSNFAGFLNTLDQEATDAGMNIKAKAGVEGPWEAAVDSPMGFNTVRHDAQISIRHSGMSQKELAAIIGNAYTKIEAGAKP